MYQIKRYANGRFYDTVAKNYITRAQIAKLLRTKKDVVIYDTKAKKDITKDIVAQIEAKKKSKQKRKPARKKEDALSGFTALFRKGGDALFDYGKKYASMWQNLVTLSKDEIDRVIGMLVRDKKISEADGSRLKAEIEKYRESVQRWIIRNIDNRVNEILNRMNLASRDQILELTAKIDELNKKISSLEKGAAKKKKTQK